MAIQHPGASNNRHESDVGSMLGQRLGGWPNIDPTSEFSHSHIRIQNAFIGRTNEV